MDRQLRERSLTVAEIINNNLRAGLVSNLRLMTAHSSLCKQDKFPVNHYAASLGKEHRDLGERVRVLIVSWEPKAMRIDGDVTTSYGPAEELFQAAMSWEFNHQGPQYNYGPEFTVLMGTNVLKLFCGTKSSRRAARKIKGYMGKEATLTTKIMSTRRYSWVTMDVND